MQRYFVNMLHFSNMNCEFMNMVYQENCKDLVSIIQQPKKKTRKQTNKTSNQGILFLDRKQLFLKNLVIVNFFFVIIFCFSIYSWHSTWEVCSSFCTLYQIVNTYVACFLFVFVMGSFTWPMYSYHCRIWMNIWLLIIQNSVCIENKWFM